ncbi:hypothetical protein D3C77_168610 [compost metagenome]
MICRRELYALGEPFGESCTREEAGRRIYGGGGGGGGKSTTTQDIPRELKPLATAYANKAMALSNQPYEPYGGQQVANMNWYQNAGAQQLADRAVYGDSLMNQAKSTMQNALASGNAATANPYGYASNVGSAAPSSNGGVNQYAGENKYLQQNIDAAMGDITRNYNNAVAPGLTTQMVGSGSFGNTGSQAATANALNDLTKNLANTSSSMRMQDYQTQQQLAESQLNRNLQNNQFNASLADTALGRNLQNNQFNANLGSDYASRNDQMRANMLNLTPTYGNQAYSDAAQLMKLGQQYQDNSQQNLDVQYQSYLDQQNLPYKQLAAMSGVFGSGLGQTSTTKSSGGGK